jgi:hypothetical protein
MATTATESMNIPDGGLASFLTSNMDEIDDNILAFGPSAGINSMADIANRMAQMGRNGDNYIVHASEREMIVPREVVENNPELRNQIMQGIAAEGADPEAYIVGSDANSINPMTGQREFFLKKLVRGVKKIAKKVVNVVKKVAPVILPIAINAIAPGLGTIASGALGAGLGTLVQGGSAKDALRSALIGGAAGGLYSGMSGVMSGQGFMSGVQQGLPAQFRPDVAMVPTASTRGAAPGGETIVGEQVAESVSAPAERGGFFDRVRDVFTPAQPASTAELAQEASRIAAETGVSQDVIFSQLAEGAGQPSVLRRFGPTLAGGLAVGALTGAFDPVEAEPVEMPGYETTSTDLLAQNPEQYRVGVAPEPTYLTASQIAVPTPYGQMVPSLPPVQIPPIQIEPIQMAAMGGEMESFPRRMGYISGPGTETSDDVPAMLSDGEFVMTARAVRGAGNGSREKGVRRMYDMMRMFEGGVAR